MLKVTTFWLIFGVYVIPFDDITDNLCLVESFYVTYISMFRTIF